ncbi:hypothetical protein KUM39_13540 [Streptomyces sp. J2-1]|uniref:hypothetical protein n=1 Tax=Streptomyces corallincola TaxID=2851888 RepID=UPI001C385396|nr:hypothetical protein [Streptomyces corallincola]MBV2355382.1 hypothetical protein [Streptomyces corallincola]
MHAGDEHPFVRRQSTAVHYEAPFLYLLCGAERAVLIDTGATVWAEFFPTPRMMDGTLAERVARQQRCVRIPYGCCTHMRTVTMCSAAMSR